MSDMAKFIRLALEDPYGYVCPTCGGTFSETKVAKGDMCCSAECFRLLQKKPKWMIADIAWAFYKDENPKKSLVPGNVNYPKRQIVPEQVQAALSRISILTHSARQRGYGMPAEEREEAEGRHETHNWERLERLRIIREANGKTPAPRVDE